MKQAKEAFLAGAFVTGASYLWLVNVPFATGLAASCLLFGVIVLVYALVLLIRAV